MPEISTWEDLLDEAEGINGHLPTKGVVKEIIKKAKDWISKAENVLVSISIIFLIPYF